MNVSPHNFWTGFERPETCLLALFDKCQPFVLVFYFSYAPFARGTVFSIDFQLDGGFVVTSREREGGQEED
jgi:hypothetical protein